MEKLSFYRSEPFDKLMANGKNQNSKKETVRAEPVEA
jgi:hypothetical protein